MPAPASSVPPKRRPLADYRRVIEVNLVAPFLLARTFGKKMLEAGRGSIINVASVAGLVAVSSDRAAYNASKHGLIGLTRTLAAEWGGRGVRVNAVCPGWVKTEMDVADQAGGSYTDADITGRIPMARFATPDDVARAIAFLADENQSSFINGYRLSSSMAAGPPTAVGNPSASANANPIQLQPRSVIRNSRKPPDITVFAASAVIYITGYYLQK